MYDSDVVLVSKDEEIDDDDDWETNDPPEFTPDTLAVRDTSTSSKNGETETVDWNTEPTHPASLEVEKKGKNVDRIEAKNKCPAEEKDSIILILVDLTALSGGKIHNKFDKNSVNDQDAKQSLCKEISLNYDSYANNSELIMNQTVRHCSETVWKDALESLRNEHAGHYWFPVFPPKRS